MRWVTTRVLPLPGPGQDQQGALDVPHRLTLGGGKIAKQSVQGDSLSLQAGGQHKYTHFCLPA